MAVQDVRVTTQGAAETWASLRTDHTGRRLVVVLGNRANGGAATVTTDQSELLSLTQRLQHVPSGGGSKTLHMFEAIIPPFAGNPILDSEVLDDGDSPVDHARVAFVVDEDYEFVTAASSDSGSTSVTSWGTGETASVPAGDLLIIAAGTSRGTTTVEWDITDAEPPNPSGGTWLLQVEQSGTAASMRTAFAGYAHLTGQSAQTWEDTLTLGTARETSVGIVVFSTGDGNGGQEDHSGAGVSATVTVDASAGAGALHVEQPGSPATITASAATATGTPVLTGSGAATGVTVTAGIGSGQAGDEDHTGSGAPAGVTLTVGDGVGSPAATGTGQGATVTMAAATGTGMVPGDVEALIVGDITGPARRHTQLPDGPALRRTVTDPALSRTLTGPET